MDVPITVVILSYNAPRPLLECLEHLKRQTLPPDEILVWDNGSTDPSIAEIRSRFPEVCLIQSGQNLGFAQGNNEAISRARNDWIALLNNDAFPEETWLESLVARLSSPETLGALSSLVTTEGTPEAWYQRGGSLSVVGRNIPLSFSSNEECFFPTGCACLFDRRKATPPFDGDYFMYGEDVYLGWSLRLQGYDILQVPEARVRHLGGASSSSLNRIRKDEYQERNRLLNLFLFLETGTLLKLIPLILIDFKYRFWRDGILGSKSGWGMLRGALWILTHGGQVRVKRQRVQSLRKVSDEAILAKMSGNLTNSSSRMGRLLNALSQSHCRVMGLKVIETLGLSSSSKQ